MIAPSPLKKRKLEGDLYTRSDDIEVKLRELLELSHNEIITRCSVESLAEDKYIPSECLMYLVRANRESAPGVYFETVYKTLLARVMEQLPSANDTNLKNSEIRAETLGDFAELLAADRLNYDERLDYYEVRFKDSVAKLRLNAAREPIRLDFRQRPLDGNPEDPEGGELAHHIEKAGGSLDHGNFQKYFGSHDRAKLDEAISTLPEHQIAILEMLKKEMPIYSEDPEVLTISKVLGKAEKTIRLHRDQAVEKLTEILRKGEP